MRPSGVEPGDLIEGMRPSRLARAARRQEQVRTVVGATKLGRYEEDALPQGLQGRGLQLRRQAQTLETVHKVVPEQEQMEVGLVGEEVAGGNTAEGVVPFELSDEQLHARPVVVEPPEVERLQRQVRDEHLV